MKIQIQPMWSDAQVDVLQPITQRQLAIALSTTPDTTQPGAPLNLCLILDHSGSMAGAPLDMVKQSAQKLVSQLGPSDRLSVIAFDHHGTVLVPSQAVTDPEAMNQKIQSLQAGGGTCIDEGMRLAIEELAQGKKDRISQALLLTDGENEHGNNERCLKLAQLAVGYNLTMHSLGFGDRWNQDILEQIADAGGGNLAHIPTPEDADTTFNRLLKRAQSVGVTNAHLLLHLAPGVRLADTKPLAQVSPDTIELTAQPTTDALTAPPDPSIPNSTGPSQNNDVVIRLGDLMADLPRVVVANLYIDQLPPGSQTIAQIQVRYDDPGSGQVGLTSATIPVEIAATTAYQPNLDPVVQQHLLALGKYRQTQLAEAKLESGDRLGAATLLQTAAKTALQLGDTHAATVLQASATQLQAGEELSQGDRKKTRLAAKTMLQ